MVPASDQAPAFVHHSTRGKNYLPYTKGSLIIFLRAKLELAGISLPRLYRGHSFRRGAASFAFHCGVPGELIQVFGDWASDAYKVYLEYSLPAKLQLANNMKEQLLKLA